MSKAGFETERISRDKKHQCSTMFNGYAYRFWHHHHYNQNNRSFPRIQSTVTLLFTRVDQVRLFNDDAFNAKDNRVE